MFLYLGFFLMTALPPSTRPATRPQATSHPATQPTSRPAREQEIYTKVWKRLDLEYRTKYMKYRRDKKEDLERMKRDYYEDEIDQFHKRIFSYNDWMASIGGSFENRLRDERPELRKLEELLSSKMEVLKQPKYRQEVQDRITETKARIEWYEIHVDKESDRRLPGPSKAEPLRPTRGPFKNPYDKYKYPNKGEKK